MTIQEEYPSVAKRQDAGVSDVLGSMMNLGAAGVKFTFRQMGNAFAIFTDSQGVMNRVRNSMDKISNAMNGTSHEANHVTHEAEVPRHSPAPAADVLSGRKA